MPSQIRRLLYSRLFIAILATSLLTGTGSLIIGGVLFRDYLDRAIQAGRAEAFDRIGIFELLMAKLLREGSATGRTGLRMLEARFPDRESALGAGREGLEQAAREAGVDEVYFIDDDGKVFATSFEPDLGLDLFSIDPSFSAFLKGIFGSGQIVDQGISGSTQTGNRNLYQYYSPPGKPYIIEVSTRMRTMVAASYPRYDYTSLAAQVLGIRLGESPLEKAAPPVQVIDYLNDAGSSIVSDDRQNEAVKRMASGGKLPDLLEWREGHCKMILERLDLSVFAAEYPYYILFRIDESYYSSFMLASALVSFAVICGASLLSFAGASKALGRKIASRLEALAEAMERVGRGEEAGILEDAENDELSSIGRQAASMVTTIRQKESDLARALESNRGLLRELDHRVKNNLQLMLSLARLQSGSGNFEFEALVEKMELRIWSMAQVQDMMNAGGSLDSIDMEPLLLDQVARVRQNFQGRDGNINCKINAGSARLGADDAMAAALISCELTDNALRHAFPPSAGGNFELAIVSSPEGDFLLEARDDGIGPSEGMAERLGLTIVRALAAQRGWAVAIEAAGPECGMSVKVGPAKPGA